MSFVKHNPSQPANVLLVSTFSAKHGAAVGESLGSEALAGHLIGERGNSVKVDHVDLQLDPDIDDLAKRIRQEKPQLVGVSVKIGAVSQAERLVKEIDQLPLQEVEKPLVVMGGVVPTFATLELLKKFPNVIVAKGEGEDTINALVGVVKGKRFLDQVPGITYRRDGNILSIPGSRFNLSKRHLPARITTRRIKDELGGMVWVESSRGCDGNCVFCSVREIHSGGFNGSIPPKAVVDGLEQLSRMGITSVSFTDDDFGGDPERTLVIAEEIIGRKLDVQFTVSTRADHIWAERLPKELVGNCSLEDYNLRLRYINERLREAGLTRVFIGLESGSSTQLRRYGKRISVAGNYRALEILKEIGIDVVAGYIPIDHLMTLQELRENLLFLRKTGMYLKVTNPLSVLRVQSGSSYIKMLRRRGLLGEMTEDLVFYKAGFSDRRVQKVAELADRWVNDMYALIFGLKGETAIATLRSTEGSGGKAEKIQAILFAFRELEMGFIEAVTTSLMEDDQTDLGAVTRAFKEKKQQLVASTEEEIKNGVLSGANHRLKEAINELSI